jgi:CheY-like chemotaxis protein
MRTSRAICWLVAMATVLGSPAGAEPPEVRQWLETVLAVAPNGVGHRQAQEAATKLQDLSPPPWQEVLVAMQSASPLAKNWLLGIAGYMRTQTPDLAPQELLDFLAATGHDVDARGLVFEWLVADDPPLRRELLAEMLEDPNLALRKAAIDQALEPLLEPIDPNVADASKQQQQHQRLEQLEQLLAVARYPAQVQQLAGLLSDAGRSVDLTQLFGFLTPWQVIGPFDNRGLIGFDAVYGPERDVLGGEFDLRRSYAGRDGEVRWQPLGPGGQLGQIDLNPTFDRVKGGVCYALHRFEAPAATMVEVRLGTPNGSKVWVNGDLVLSNAVYHAGYQIDQYIGRTQLRAGENTVLVKLLQNEQTEEWAADYEFQLRLSDPAGRGLPFPAAMPDNDSVAPR